MKWLRLYDDLLDDPKAQQLPAALFKHWINLLCLASKSEPRGTLPTVTDTAFRLRLSEAKTRSILKELTGMGLIDRVGETLQMHNWNERQRASDNVAARVQKHRATVSGNGSVTLQETLPKRDGNALDTDTETDTDADPETETSSQALTPLPTLAHLPGERGAENGETATDDDADAVPEESVGSGDSDIPDDDQRAESDERPSGTTKALDRRFEQFWSAYPRKVGKVAAQRAWNRLRPDAATLDRMLDVIANERGSEQWRREGGRFIPHPTTWLNQGRWEDEPIALDAGPSDDALTQEQLFARAKLKRLRTRDFQSHEAARYFGADGEQRRIDDIARYAAIAQGATP